MSPSSSLVSIPQLCAGTAGRGFPQQGTVGEWSILKSRGLVQIIVRHAAVRLLRWVLSLQRVAWTPQPFRLTSSTSEQHQQIFPRDAHTTPTPSSCCRDLRAAVPPKEATRTASASGEKFWNFLILRRTASCRRAKSTGSTRDATGGKLVQSAQGESPGGVELAVNREHPLAGLHEAPGTLNTTASLWWLIDRRQSCRAAAGSSQLSCGLSVRACRKRAGRVEKAPHDDDRVWAGQRSIRRPDLTSGMEHKHEDVLVLVYITGVARFHGWNRTQARRRCSH